LIFIYYKFDLVSPLDLSLHESQYSLGSFRLVCSDTTEPSRSTCSLFHHTIAFYRYNVLGSDRLGPEGGQISKVIALSSICNCSPYVLSQPRFTKTSFDCQYGNARCTKCKYLCCHRSHIPFSQRSGRLNVLYFLLRENITAKIQRYLGSVFIQNALQPATIPRGQSGDVEHLDSVVWPLRSRTSTEGALSTGQGFQSSLQYFVRKKA
jgi:hypothetical protein